MWLPDPDAVWVSGLLLQDYSPVEKHLLLELSDGRVRHAQPPPTPKKHNAPNRITLSPSVPQRELPSPPAGGPVPGRFPLGPPAAGEPRHPGGGERSDGPELPPRTRGAAQPAGSIPGLQQHLHVLR